jgi:hypothetical protein
MTSMRIAVRGDKTSKYTVYLIFNQLISRGAVIRCLSNIAFEHRVLGVELDLKKECKKQLRVAYLQQEQVDVNFGYRQCCFLL